MREIAEFRIDERFASLLFSPEEGRRLGDSVRKVEVATDDVRFRRIGELQAELIKSVGSPFFFGWDLTRRYVPAELAAAKLLTLLIAAVFEPAGEECGTTYDESTACGRCGAGATQTGPLVLDLRRVPKNRDIAKTIAGEIVVSERLAGLWERYRVTGVTLQPVQNATRTPAGAATWYQLTARSRALVVPPTRAGNNLFDADPTDRYKCSEHLLGLNLLSEVWVDQSTVGDVDIVASQQYVGVRRGLLRPQPILLISPRVWRTVVDAKVNGLTVEIAHLV